jgi:hypothetical protein
LMNLTLKAFLGRVSLVGGDHLDESEAARLLGVRIAHDVALLNLAVLLKKTRHLFLSKRRVDAGDEQVGTRVTGALFILFFVARSWGWTTMMH